MKDIKDHLTDDEMIVLTWLLGDVYDILQNMAEDDENFNYDKYRDASITLQEKILT